MKNTKIVTVTIRGKLYETDGITIRVKKYPNGGFLYVKQLSNELKKEIERKLQWQTKQ